MPLLRRGDCVFPLQAERAHTPPLGVTPELEAGEARVQLHSGDMLLMVSDGILEARDARDTQRAISPLKPAEDAQLLDNSSLTIEQSADRVLQWWSERNAFDAVA